MKKDVSLSEVARAAGVSIAAASRALNGRDGVREEIRERVKATASSLGYRPNRSARSLAGGRAGVIALILDVNQLRYGRYASELLRALSYAAASRDEGVLLVGESGRSPSDAMQNLMRDGIVDGVVISAVAFGEVWVEEVIDAEIPTVLVGAHPRRSGVPVVDVDNYSPCRLLVSQLAESGCERIATITGRLGRVDAQVRLEGYYQGLRDAGRQVDPSLVFEGDFNRRSGMRLADSVLASNADAVFCANDEMALGLYEALHSRGVSIPDDISIAGFDCTARFEYRAPDLTSIEPQWDELAGSVFQAMTAMLDGDEVEIEQVVPAKIYCGETTRPLPGDATD